VKFFQWMTKDFLYFGMLTPYSLADFYVMIWWIYEYFYFNYISCSLTLCFFILFTFYVLTVFLSKRLTPFPCQRFPFSLHCSRSSVLSLLLSERQTYLKTFYSAPKKWLPFLITLITFLSWLTLPPWRRKQQVPTKTSVIIYLTYFDHVCY
jgi:hypothetical protein